MPNWRTFIPIKLPCKKNQVLNSQGVLSVECGNQAHVAFSKLTHIVTNLIIYEGGDASTWWVQQAFSCSKPRNNLTSGMSEGGAMVDSNALHLGIDFGSFNIKALLCTAAHEPLRQLCEPSRGNLKTSLLQILDSLLSEFPNTLQLKVAVTGSGQASIKSLEAVLLVQAISLKGLARSSMSVGNSRSGYFLTTTIDYTLS
jgi:hypothetical protein